VLLIAGDMARFGDIRKKLGNLWPHLNERSRRMLAAAEAAQLGYGGVSLVSRACGLSRVTIIKGLGDLAAPPLPAERVRRAGGDVGSWWHAIPGYRTCWTLWWSPWPGAARSRRLRWTCKSTRTLAGELTDRQHPISHEKVAQLLRGMNYSLQSNRKTGEDHPDRDAQFRHINKEVRLALKQGRPVISRGHQEKGTDRQYQNKGRQWRRQTAEPVADDDFPAPSVPRAYPYGIYDLGRNTGLVNVGTDHDTAAFAVASIRGWWRKEGGRLYPGAARLLDHGRRRRQQWLPPAPLETGVTAAGRPDRSGDCGFATFRRARASGTRWNTASSPSFPPIGAANPCVIMKPSSV